MLLKFITSKTKSGEFKITKLRFSDNDNDRYVYNFNVER